MFRRNAFKYNNKIGLLFNLIHSNMMLFKPIQTGVLLPVCNQKCIGIQSENTLSVIILAGPGGEAYDNELVVRTKEVFEKQKSISCVTVIGDGEKNLCENDMNNLMSIVATDQSVLLIVMAHGVMKDRNHFHNLKGNDDLTSSSEFLKLIAKNIEGRQINIFSIACHGGAVNRHAKLLLPPKSVYVSLSPESDVASCYDFEMLIRVMSDDSNNSIHSTEDLLTLYLTKALATRTSPVVTCDGNTLMSLQTLFLTCLGKRFSIEEKEVIYADLGSFVDREKISKTIHKIESARHEFSITAKYYGLALAICRSADKFMYKYLQSYKANKMTS